MLVGLPLNTKRNILVDLTLPRHPTSAIVTNSTTRPVAPNLDTSSHSKYSSQSRHHNIIQILKVKSLVALKAWQVAHG